MTTTELARALAAHGETEDASKAYTLSLEQADGTDPAAELEAAAYLMDSGGDYRISYTTFQSLYNRGHFQQELFDLMVGAFYAPNLKPQEKQYQRNCKLLAKYPYLFQKDFLPFDDLPVKLFPYDDNGFLPFDVRENRFGDYVNLNHPVVSRNFFADLEHPILAQDVYSQYELEYLNDNVRKSEWVARENHIYLHYTDWGTFCSYLQGLDLRDLLKEEKLVFLIGAERNLYPINFQERFGIDYSQYTVKPIGVREVKKLIWHTQLSSHNGGDFINEIFYGHPNLLAYESIMLDTLHTEVKQLKEKVALAVRTKGTLEATGGGDPVVLNQLLRLRDLTDKDVAVATFLAKPAYCQGMDPNSRIAPALFFQPHFHNLYYNMTVIESGQTVLSCDQYRQIQESPIFQGFRYIKTFTPMRRLTTSYAATIRFMLHHSKAAQAHGIVSNVINERLLNRSFMIDWQDRLYQDSVLVRFEDAKLNPKATLPALAAFLDLPYTQSMTYCSGPTGVNPESFAGNAIGFDPVTVYRTYDEFANDTERYYIEYFMRDVYEHYGYDFQYYDGAPVDEARARTLISGFTTLNRYMRETMTHTMQQVAAEKTGGELVKADGADATCDQYLAAQDEERIHLAQILLKGLTFINRNGQPLRMMPQLELDPALLEQPLYH